MLGTKSFIEKFKDKLPAHNFRQLQDLWVSSIGIGTYLGNPDDETDQKYIEAIKRAVQLGCNHIDTSSNYRHQRSERAIGKAIKQLAEEGIISREELVIATKGGYLPFDTTFPQDPQKYFHEKFIATGLITGQFVPGKMQEIVNGHCLSPKFIDNQFETSLRNMMLDYIDVYYLHNPETQLQACISFQPWNKAWIEDVKEEFKSRIKNAFEVLEQKVSEGKLKYYGLATWDGLRVDPENESYVSLEEIWSIAKEVGGENHKFRAIQLPYNLSMQEAILDKNQKVNGKWMSTVEAANRLGISVVCSASLMQGQVVRNLPQLLLQQFPGLKPAQIALILAKSTEGITSSLVGMKRIEHVNENLKVMEI